MGKGKEWISITNGVYLVNFKPIQKPSHPRAAELLYMPAALIEFCLEGIWQTKEGSWEEPKKASQRFYVPPERRQTPPMLELTEMTLSETYKRPDGPYTSTWAQVVCNVDGSPAAPLIWSRQAQPKAWKPFLFPKTGVTVNVTLVNGIPMATIARHTLHASGPDLIFIKSQSLGGGIPEYLQDHLACYQPAVRAALEFLHCEDCNHAFHYSVYGLKKSA